MRKFAALISLGAVLLTAGACQSGGSSDSETTAPAGPAPSLAAETTPPLELDPASHATPEFSLPAELTDNAELAFPYLLEYDHQAWNYDIAVDGIGADDHIFITSYLLPESTEYPDYDSRIEFIREYDALIDNGAHESSHAPALVSGIEGVFRFAIIRDGEGPTLYQRNFFLFAQNHVVQISCQWAETRDIVGPICGELQETFVLK